MENMKEPVKMMLTLKEASAVTGLTYSCLRRLCLAEEIPFIKSGNKYFLNAQKLLDYCNQGCTA